MCGIAGVISQKVKPDLKATIQKMLEVIQHRGPDGQGIECYKDQIALGHRRLAIIDLSDFGKQPMQYLDKYCITFNGEIYNYLEIKEELKKEGYHFISGTDTEVILAAYDKWKESCVRHFNGMWAFAIYDIPGKKVFCSRDRFGVKPFYYMEHENIFYFSSEIKQLLPFLKTVYANKTALEAYLLRGCLDYTDQTMFKDVKQLQGGYNLEYSLVTYQYRVKQWYSIYDIEENAASFDENKELFRNYFLNSIRFRLRADVPVGSCLSGGLDSSAIVCVIQKLLEEKGAEIQQFTISSCFNDKRYDEQFFADKVVEQTGAKSCKVFPDMSKVFDELDTIIWHMDEPFGSTSIYAQWNVFRKAKELGLTVMLDGQGADEQLAGYTSFYRVLFVDLLKKGEIAQLFNEIKCYKKLRSSSEARGLFLHLAYVMVKYLVPSSLANKIEIVCRNVIDGSPFPNNFYKNPIVKASYSLYNEKNYRDYIGANMVQGMQALLHYEDRNSMAHSIESRVPFLDYRLVECIYAMPLKYKISRGRTKYVMREALQDILPSEIYNRYSKLGFVTPEDQWIKDNQVFFEKELMKACDVLSPLLNKSKVKAWYRRRISKMKRGNFAAWRIICAARWMNIFNVCFEDCK